MIVQRIWMLVAEAASNLPPSYFSLVMATGIVSIAAYVSELKVTSWLLFEINKVAYASLLSLTLIRAVGYFPRLRTDLVSHTRGPGLLTMIAATSILGSQFVVLDRSFGVASGLWLFAVVLWCCLMYAFLAAMTIGKRKPNLEAGLDGDWLITVVATQSISLLGTLVAPRFGSAEKEVLFLTLSGYLLGCALYIVIISLIFYRLTFFAVTPEEFTPSYWVNMGAVAITTLAGSLLLLVDTGWSFLRQVMPFLKGFTLFFWVFGTWWIPLILILEVWRYVFKGFPLRYNLRQWDIVFPLGMYTVSTFEFGKASGLSFLVTLSGYFLAFALGAWLLAFIGLVRMVFRELVRSLTSGQ